MKIKTLTAQNFRLMESFTLKFSSDITVLIGPNNVGKSSVVDALLFLKQCIPGSAETAYSFRGGFIRIISRHDAQKSFILESTYEDENRQDVSWKTVFSSKGLIETRIRTANGTLFQASSNQGSLNWIVNNTVIATGHQFLTSNILPLFGVPYEAELLPLRNFFSSLVHVDPFRKVSFQSQIAPTKMVNPTGEDLAQVLHHYYVSERERFDQFEESVQRIFPDLQMIETPLSGAPHVTVSLKYKNDSMKYNLWQVSSGLKDILVLIVAIHFSDPGSLIILEEPENHLHPSAQKALCTIISEEASRGVGKQFLITTHSEFVMQQFDREKVRLVSRQESGSVAVPLAETDLQPSLARVSDEGTVLQLLSNRPQVIVVMEGRDDYKALEPLWEYAGIRDKVLPRKAEGSGWREIVDSARQLRESLARFRFPNSVFIILDSDGAREECLVI